MVSGAVRPVGIERDSASMEHVSEKPVVVSISKVREMFFTLYKTREALFHTQLAGPVLKVPVGDMLLE